MRCPKCGSENVSVQAVQETRLIDQHHGCLWWCFIGWWWVMIKWLCFFWLALLAKIFAPKKQRLKQKTRSVCICQNCGHNWRA